MTSYPFNNKMVEALSKSSIRKLFATASRNIRKASVVDLTLGNPFGQPPKQFYNRLHYLIINDKDHAYMDNAGYADIRASVALSLIKRQLMPATLTGQDIIMTPGASSAINCVLKSILNPSEEVIVLAPYFPDYPQHIENHGGIPRIVTLAPPSFKLDMQLIENAMNKNTKAIIINSPNNPTGNIYTQNEITLLHKLLNKKKKYSGHPIYLISDEPYREILYDKKSTSPYISPATSYKYSFMVYSFSKSLNIPGERIGYIAIHPLMPHKHTAQEVIALSQRTLGFTNAPALMQKAVTSLLDIKPDVKPYVQKRRIICSGLKKCGFTFIEPQGAFYIFVAYPCEPKLFLKLCNTHGMYVVPGQAVGIPGYFRIAFSRSDEILKKAVAILNKIAKKLNLPS